MKSRITHPITASLAVTPVTDVYQIDTDALEVEPKCQRPVSKTRAAKIASAWNDGLAGMIQVAEVVDEDGNYHYYVMDGWTRREGARIAEIPTLRALVHKDLSEAARADKFLELNENTVKPGKMDHHRIALTAERADAKAIDTILATYGLRIGGSPSRYNVAAVAGCYSALKHGETAFGNAIMVLQAAWGHEGGEQWKGEFIVGLTRLFAHHPTVKVERVIKTLSKLTPDRCTAEILDRSSGSGGSGGRPIHMEKFIVEKYNSNLRVGRI